MTREQKKKVAATTLKIAGSMRRVQAYWHGEYRCSHMQVMPSRSADSSNRKKACREGKKQQNNTCALDKGRRSFLVAESALAACTVGGPTWPHNRCRA